MFLKSNFLIDNEYLYKIANENIHLLKICVIVEAGHQNFMAAFEQADFIWLRQSLFFSRCQYVNPKCFWLL